MSADAPCCSGDGLKGLQCKPDEDGTYACAWECSDENLDERGIPADPCHPFFEDYLGCHHAEERERAALLSEVKGDLSSMGGLLQKGRLDMGGEEVLIFDPEQCSSTETCLRHFEKNLAASEELYETRMAEKEVELEQAVQKYRLDSSDVCREYGSDGFCKRFVQTAVPSKFMIASIDVDRMADHASLYEKILNAPRGRLKDEKALRRAPSALFSDIGSASCWDGSMWTSCDPASKDQQFEFEKKMHRGKQCRGDFMNRDTSAQLEGYTEESCRFLCDSHADCMSATYRPYFEKNGKAFSGHCEIMSTFAGTVDSPGATCLEYVREEGSAGRSMLRRPPSTDNFVRRHIWS